ncbi:MAG: DUF600 family protein [Clostridia bacterium]|nr:DUF600 family protein [Clostridia bacterium]
MLTLPEEKVLYSEIQKKIFYIIPERWESIYLYTSIIDVSGDKPVRGALLLLSSKRYY